MTTTARNDAQLNVRMPVELKRQLVEECVRRRWSPSEFIRELLTAVYRTHRGRVLRRQILQ